MVAHTHNNKYILKIKFCVLWLKRTQTHTHFEKRRQKKKKTVEKKKIWARAQTTNEKKEYEKKHFLARLLSFSLSVCLRAEEEKTLKKSSIEIFLWILSNKRHIESWVEWHRMLFHTIKASIHTHHFAVSLSLFSSLIHIHSIMSFAILCAILLMLTFLVLMIFSLATKKKSNLHLLLPFNNRTEWERKPNGTRGKREIEIKIFSVCCSGFHSIFPVVSQQNAQCVCYYYCCCCHRYCYCFVVAVVHVACGIFYTCFSRYQIKRPARNLPNTRSDL